jgi:hypothetical protein
MRVRSADSRIKARLHEDIPASGRPTGDQPLKRQIWKLRRAAKLTFRFVEAY